MRRRFVNRSHYDHLRLLRDAPGIILEPQRWWADLHLGKRDLPLRTPEQNIHLINASRMGEAGLRRGGCWGPAGPGRPGRWPVLAGPAKEDSHPGLGTQASSLPKGRRVQSPGAEISHRGTWRWRAHEPPLKEHFLGGRVESAQSDQVLCAEDVEGR